ncbi:D-2-hydroxyacid dehydrogenase [Paenibacillus sp. R14(2021)]|uniref:D-2-hydroxyacid dehydrogenase n=1 Tax=Paenibacillus sp. R14(2021) TaxID=2859228 RepID=UPI001C613873|nr:D-2-hydroxyacid dehydrogenase [Paenibacillus sp. R14(2021)]
MRTIVSVHAFNQEQVKAIQDALPGASYTDVSGMEPEEARERLIAAEIILGWNRDVKKILYTDGPALKWLQNLGAGVDHIPLDRIAALGVVLTNASGVHPSPISETIFAMLLSLTRGVHTAVRNQQSSAWKPNERLGEAHNKTISIIGVGAIGLETAKIAKAFGMNVLGIRKSGEAAEWVDRMYSVNELGEVLAQSDYVVNCLPLTHETKHLLGREQFEAMKPSAYYINIGRGGTTDTSALVDALQSGSIAGAGLDVFEQEPLPADHPLWQLDNVMITPHESGNTAYYFERALEIVLDNLAHYRQNGTPGRNIVDYRSQY